MKKVAAVPKGYIPVPEAAVAADLSDRGRKLLLHLCRICWNGVEFVKSQPMSKAELAVACNLNRHVIGDQMPVLEKLGFAHLTPVLAGALFVVTIGNRLDGTIRARHGIVIPEDVGGVDNGIPGIVTNGTIRAAQRGLDSLYTGNPPQVQDKKALDGTIRATHGIVLDAGWEAVYGALLAVGVYSNLALEIARAELVPLMDVLRHIRAWQAEGDRTGVGSLVARLRDGATPPDVCPDCGHSRKGTHNFQCPTCTDFMREEYGRWNTDDNAQDEA